MSSKVLSVLCAELSSDLALGGKYQRWLFGLEQDVSSDRFRGDEAWVDPDKALCVVDVSLKTGAWKLT